MPYYKVYNRKIYDSEVKCLLIKIRSDEVITDKEAKMFNKLFSLSLIYESALGIISTIFDPSIVEESKIRNDNYSISKPNYDKIFKSIFGVEYSYTFDKLMYLRNTICHNYSKAMAKANSLVNSLGLVDLIKLLLEMHKKSGMGRELALCVYDMFKDRINVEDLFSTDTEFKLFKSMLNESLEEYLFESAIDFLLVRR